MAILAIGLMIIVKKYFSRLPFVLVSVVVTTIISWIINFETQFGGKVVGNIPQGLPELTIPNIDISQLINLGTVAIVISLIGFMEAISIAKAMAAQTKQRLDADQELVGQGLVILWQVFFKVIQFRGLSQGLP